MLVLSRTLSWTLALTSAAAGLQSGCSNANNFKSAKGGGSEQNTNQNNPGPAGAGAENEDTRANGAGRQIASFTVEGSVDIALGYQGIAPDSGDEEFTQTNLYSGLLDILLVVDNSASMDEEQINLASKLQVLLQDPRVKAADWRIGVTTTDRNDQSLSNAETSCLRDLIKRGDSDVGARFAKAVTPGTAGDNQEQGVYTAVEALRGGCMGGKRWLRDASALAVIIVSDEDNCSNGYDKSCAGKDYRDAAYLTNYLASIRKLGSEARVYGIIWSPETICPKAFNRANIYNEAIKSAGGVAGSICDDDYSATLSKMSSDISTIIKNQFSLKIAPPPGSAVVSIDGVEQKSGYNIRGSTLSFDKAPTEGSKIKVAYNRAGFPFFTTMPLPKDIAGIKQVQINGLVMDPASWSWDASNQMLAFGTVPPQGAEIRVAMIRLDLTASKRFSIAGPIDPTSVEATVDGRPLPIDIPEAGACRASGPCQILSKTDLALGNKVTISYSSL